MAVVCRRTGLKPDLLRAWERRHGVVKPGRSPTGRRRYADSDIERLILLRRAVDGGRSIGQLADLDLAALTALISEDERARIAPATATPERDQVANRLAACLDAVATLDSDGLSYELERSALILSRRALVDELIAPLMWTIGEQWRQGALGVAHEHAASAVLRTFLGRLPSSARGRGPRLLVATLAGEQHETGALLVAAVAAAEGWTVTYLGPNLPAEELANAARSTAARVVAVSVVQDLGPATARELERLAQLLGDQVVLLAGGRGAGPHAGLLRRMGGAVLTDLDELRQRLGRLNAA